MVHSRLSLALLCFVPLAAHAQDAPWPSAGGPNGNWCASGAAAPDAWSVTTMRNIVWRTPLPAGGQSGIAIGAGRLFLTTLKPFEPQANGADVSKTSTDVVGWCLDAASGKILWSIALPGSVASPNLYAYSDSSSPTPLTDGTHVWFFNASGGLGCWTVDGKEVWRRSWKPWSEADGYPFNKQFEPILFGDWVFNVEPRDEGDPQRVHGWNWLRAIDKQTGKTAWIAEDATTTYNTPVLGKTADGTPAILHARGGWHGVPETPVGLSLSSLAGPQPGRTLWRWIAGTDANGEALAQPGTLGAPTWQALYVQHWDARHAYWFVHNPIESHLVFDVRTGTLERVQSLVHGVDWRRFDPVANAYIAQLDVNLRELADPAPRMHWDAAKDVLVVHPAWHSNIVVAGYHYFMCSTAHSRNASPNATRPDRNGRAGPSHCVGRVNVETGHVEYLELPVQVLRAVGQADRFLWGEEQRTRTLDSRGQDPVAEDRSRTDGWEIPAFWGSPTSVNERVFFTTTLGITYVINAAAQVLDASALLSVSDLGPAGDTWSLNSLSYAAGRLYHRSLREVVCIGK